MSVLLSLADEVEALVVRSPRMNARIECARPLRHGAVSNRPSDTVAGKVVTRYNSGSSGTAWASDITGSLDSLKHFIGRELPGWSWSLSNTGEDDLPSACFTEPDGDCRDFTGCAVTPELALCAAALRALASQEAS